jgi:hypothetical protein
MKYKANMAPSSSLSKINVLLGLGYTTTTIVNKEKIYVKLYHSIYAAVRDIGTSHNSLLNYINTNKLFINVYIIKKIKVL